MKKVLGMMAIMLLVMADVASAHPPSKVDLNYDKATKTLSSTMIHHTWNTTMHKISKVEVSVNGKLLKVERFARQFNKIEQRLSITLEDIKPGDEISIMAYCNIFGKRGASLKVED